MGEVVIAEHALKHGLRAEEIAFAWDNYIGMQFRGAPREGEIVVVGPTPTGEVAELVAAERGNGVVIFHAIKPPTGRVLRELGLEVRRP